MRDPERSRPETPLSSGPTKRRVAAMTGTPLFGRDGLEKEGREAKRERLG